MNQEDFNNDEFKDPRADGDTPEVGWQDSALEKETVDGVYGDQRDYHENFWSTFVVNHEGESVPYADYVWDIISNLREHGEGVLDTFGDFVPGMPNVLVAPETKLFIWLEAVLKEDTLREKIIYSSSTVLLEALDGHVEMFNDTDKMEEIGVEGMYDILVEDMLNFFDGC